MPEKTHDLKTWPEYFAEIANRTGLLIIHNAFDSFSKRYLLVLQEWNPETKDYTGREITKKVGYLLQEGFGLPDDICVMSLLPAK